MRYNHLTFRVFPGDGTTVWYDYVNTTEVTVALTGGNVTVRNLSHEYSLEFMDQRLDS